MAQITLDIPAGAQTTRVLDAICALHGYNAATDGTKAAFAKKVVIRWVKEEVRRYEVRLAADAAVATASSGVDTGITIT